MRYNIVKGQQTALHICFLKGAWKDMNCKKDCKFQINFTGIILTASNTEVVLTPLFQLVISLLKEGPKTKEKTNQICFNQKILRYTKYNSKAIFL